VERFLKFFMDDFSIFCVTFLECLPQLNLVLVQCRKKNLTFNWEEYHFMVKQGIGLEHVISKKGIDIDKAKIKLIGNLPPFKLVKDIRSFLGHTGFYRCFIIDFRKIARLLTNLLTKEVPLASLWNALRHSSY